LKAIVPQAEADGSGDVSDLVFEAPSVLRIVWADPQHMPEHIAIWSLAHFGPRADAAVARLRRQHPDADRAELERRVIDRQTKVAMTEGAFVGGPFIILMAVGFCAALLAQAQMVFALAAVSGRDPKDERRVADLLVLLDAYPTTEEANAALIAMTRDPKLHEGKRLPRGTRWSTIMRMAYLLEVLGTSDDRSRLRATMGWIGVGVLFVVGFALPLVWVPYMAYSSRKFTVRLGRRAREYYSAVETGEAGVVVQRHQTLQIGGTVALGRTLLLVLVPIVVALVALITDFSFGDGRWVDSGLLLIGLSLLATLAWLGYRWWRLRRARPARAAA
jgi:hypothetical protein